jgi:hypothetical protein
VLAPLPPPDHRSLHRTGSAGGPNPISSPTASAAAAATWASDSDSINAAAHLQQTPVPSHSQTAHLRALLPRGVPSSVDRSPVIVPATPMGRTVAMELAATENRRTSSTTAADPRARLCQHRDDCALYALKGLARGLLIGLGLRGALRLLVALSRFAQFRRRPWHTLAQAFLGEPSLRLAMFLGTYVLAWRGAVCALRHWRRSGPDDGWNAPLSGALAGLGFIFARNTDVSMYFSSKAAEALFNAWVRRHGWSTVPGLDLLIFASGCGVLFAGSVLEPYTIRPSYWKFLYTASNGRYDQFEQLAKAWAPDWFQRANFQYGWPK